MRDVLVVADLLVVRDVLVVRNVLEVWRDVLRTHRRYA